MNDSQVVFSSISFDCSEYEPSPGKYEHARVAVSPIRLLYTKDFDGRGRDEYIILNGCNMYKSCKSSRCVYSAASRDEARERRAVREAGA